MNLFSKSTKVYIVFLLLYGLGFPPATGQGNAASSRLVPEIYTYDIPAHYNRYPNTSFCRNDTGIVFIGKENGLLTIDQDQVLFHPTGDPVFITRTENDRIAYTTGNDFGFLDYHVSKGLVLESRLHMIDVHFPDFHPLQAATYGSSAFFATTEGVFMLNDTSARQFFFNRQQCRLLPTGEQLYLEVENMGLFQWQQGEFKMVLSPGNYSKAGLLSAIDWEQQSLFFTGDENAFFFDPPTGSRTGKPLPSVARGPYRLVRHIANSHYLASDTDLQLCIYDRTGDRITPLSSSVQMPLVRLQSVFTDRFNDTWIIFDFNIYKVEYPSRSQTLDLTDVIRGTILSAAFREETMYLGTDNGLYMFNPYEPGNSGVNLFPEKNGFFHRLECRDGLLIAAGNTGMYVIRGTNTERITEGQCAGLQIIDKNRVLGCSEEGLQLFTKDTDGWNAILINDTITQLISSAVTKEGVWLQTDRNAILHFETARKKIRQQPGLSGDSLEKLVVNNGRLLLIGEKNIFSLDTGNPDYKKLRLSYFSRKLLLADLVVNSRQNLWSISRNNSGGSTIWKLGDDLVQTPFFEIMGRKAFGQVLDIDESNGYIWVTGSKKIIRLDTTGVRQDRELLRIRSAVNMAGDPDEQGTLIHDSSRIPFSDNRIVINLADTRYLSDPAPYYRYKLTKYQESWSDWSRKRTIKLEKLKERDYQFTAQSVSAFGELSKPVSFGFTITPPFYRQWYAWIIYFLVSLTIAFLVYKWRLLNLKRVEYKLEEKVRERMKSVLSEKEKSDKLVADLFPKGTAEELKAKGRAASKKFEMATVLFSDIQGFTKIAEEMNPEVLIDELDKFFFHFDSVVEKYNIEKIKTIGDAYMAAGGIPVKNSSNPVEVVLAGLEMQYYMKELKRKKTDIWDLRIGIHTGPVISGVVGHKKLSYDIWGDTVNTASRMESSGEGGKVNISGITYGHVKDFFICEYRGKLPVKYKGNIDMYFVTGLRPELSVDLQGIPNKRFFTKLQMLKIKDVEERVTNMIFETPLINFHFHKQEFINRVAFQAELLGRSEELSDEEMLILHAAAVVLFAGLSETYEKLENKSVEIAREILPEHGFNERQIERICNMVLSTRPPFEPQNILEKILIDARHEFIGRSDYLTQIRLLYLEMKNNIQNMTRDRFIREQARLLENFEYYTLAARRLREVNAEDQLKNLHSWEQ